MNAPVLPASNAPISFRRAALALQQDDRTGRALKAMVMRREEETGERIATRLRGKKQPKMRVTLSALYRHLPELKTHESQDQTANLIRRYVQSIDERISERAAEKVQELVMPQIADDRRRIRVLEVSSDELKGLVLQLAKQVDALAQMKP